MQEAEMAVQHLCSIVDKMLRSNEELCRRIQNWEASGFVRSIRTPDGADIQNLEHGTSTDLHDLRELHSSSEPSTVALNTDKGDDENVLEQLNSTRFPFSFLFEKELYESRVYRKISSHSTRFSMISNARSTLAFSMSSSITMGDVSALSVYALPVFAHEISNASCYSFRPVPNRSGRLDWRNNLGDTGNESLSETEDKRSRLTRRSMLLWNKYRRTRYSPTSDMSQIYVLPTISVPPTDLLDEVMGTQNLFNEPVTGTDTSVSNADRILDMPDEAPKMQSSLSRGSPTGNQLRTAREVRFNDVVEYHTAWTNDEYNRDPRTNDCDRLTPRLAVEIKEEINAFKMVSLTPLFQFVDAR